ncbi:uncharacterized protein SPSK_01523 [Sporothrix schenckii 1099-18]|uniref:Zn(2)-C6 fungal-type domain-containing protein n=2 Tax=Sporothrix schenckii TaxID=29908 RepID=U7PKP8_SPOS1|nr:uncharacterized protein SPSK_01523 [Sporothrix schenckii 1099-18]ERS95309.1 hypothetical protein HMPREF1624_08187 [Sporothrix schenckii ATCC 58251]KJR87582.1 hypothetical protein SPSK_01523 [Sporothrix schenckii 1099-18]
MSTARPGSPATSGSRRPNKRPRVLVACQRCKTRRQRCDNGSPSCGNCARSDAACLYGDRTAYPPSYVKALEARVKELEGRSPTSTDKPETGTPASSAGGDRLVTGMGLLSSCAAAEPHYFGFSAGLSLAHFVQVALDFGSVASEDVVSLPLLTDRPFANKALNQAPNQADTAVPASLPAPCTGTAYIRAYLQLIHPLYPFLDRRQLWALHSGATGRTRAQVDPMDAALLHLVYAIGSRCLQLLGKETSLPSTSPPQNDKNGTPDPEGHFLRAMQIIGDGLQFTSVRSIELTLLLAIQSMRSPSGTSVWHLAGLAVRQCIELGLHRQRAVRGGDAAVDEHRRRLFWSVYIFERKTALVLGRPFALSDEEIDAPMPGRCELQDGDGTNVRFHCAHIELYQLHTQIRLALYQLKRGGQGHRLQLTRTISTLLGELDAWKESVLQTFDPVRDRPSVVVEVSTDSPPADLDRGPCTLTRQTELLLEFHKARRSLLQPLMTEGRLDMSTGTGTGTGTGTDAGNWANYAAVADASGQICQLYRRLHRLAPVPFSLRDLHAIFVAGFTLIYAVCSAPALYTERGSSCARDLGACSTLLYVIAEQWASAKKYRDAFEVVAEKMEASVARYEREGGHRGPRSQSLSGSMADGETEERPVMLTADNTNIGAGPVEGVPYGPVAADVTKPVDVDELGGHGTSGMSAGIELDLESDIYGIEGLLSSEGLDWFTEAVF